MKALHRRLQLFTDGSDAYVFVPTDSVAQSLTIYRSSGEIVLNHPDNTLNTTARQSGRTIYGIIGLISLSMSEYIIVITACESRGHLCGHDVLRATEFDILPLNPNVSTVHPPHPVEGHLLALIRSHLQGGLFLFSHGWDITRRMQAQWQSRNEDERKAFWEVADDRFFWNKFLQTRLIEITNASKHDLSAFILPVMYGTFDVRPAVLQGRRMEIALISRRSRFRAGTRYFRRGIDQEGHVANFNETEQFLFVEGASSSVPNSFGDDDYPIRMSFVQIRGSVPLYWAEINTLRYKPDLQVMDLQDTADAMRTHLQDQVNLYGDQVLVNLVNQKGHEKPVKEAYERYVTELNLPKVRYQYFDFHTECKKMRWDRISILIDGLQSELESNGYFYLDSTESSPKVLQTGVVRTNCMDNLDRTNVVQASLAKWTLNRQLKSLDILPAEGSIDHYEAVSRDFREIWADHADLISKAYAGSGALKSDFTRTNKRTRMGVLEDGVKSILRYVKNNYFDGNRQDGYDLVTGNWVPRKNPSNSLFLVSDPRPLITRSMPIVSSFSMFMVCAGMTLPRTSDYSLIYYFMLWLLLFAVSVAFIVVHGIDYVAWPRLIPSTDAIYYKGPGFRSAHHGKGFAGKLEVRPGRRLFTSAPRKGHSIGLDDKKKQG